MMSPLKGNTRTGVLILLEAWQQVLLVPNLMILFVEEWFLTACFEASIIFLILL